jgi:crotonyl-CoA carboxylase/reductase
MNTRPMGAELLAAAQNKDLYDIGDIPPLGHVPASMYAWVVRKDRHGPPEQSMQVEVVPTWTLDSHDVLVLVMAAGVNYNGVWAALGEPVSPLDVHKNPYHIAGSDASGVVWAVGSKVKRWKVGDGSWSTATRTTATTRSATAATRCSPPRNVSGAMRRRTVRSLSSAACKTGS